jgi:hypothetical protein
MRLSKPTAGEVCRSNQPLRAGGLNAALDWLGSFLSKLKFKAARLRALRVNADGSKKSRIGLFLCLLRGSFWQ